MLITTGATDNKSALVEAMAWCQIVSHRHIGIKHGSLKNVHRHPSGGQPGFPLKWLQLFTKIHCVRNIIVMSISLWKYFIFD